MSYGAHRSASMTRSGRVSPVLADSPSVALRFEIPIDSRDAPGATTHLISIERDGNVEMLRSWWWSMGDDTAE